MSDPVTNPGMTPPRAAPETLLRAALANSLALLLCIAMVLGSLLVFALPWRVPFAIGGATLAHYAPLHDGDAQLMIEYGPTNTPEKWVSQNHYVLLSVADLTTQLSPESVRSIAAVFGGPAAGSADLTQRLRDVQIAQTQQRVLQADGSTHSHLFVTLRDLQGERILSEYEPDAQQERIYDPPLLRLPADLTMGAVWHSAGILRVADGLSMTYAYTGQVAMHDQHLTEAYRNDDCLRVDTTLSLTPNTAQPNLSEHNNATASTTDSQDWYCAGIGWVESQFSNGPQQNNQGHRVLAQSAVRPALQKVHMPSLDTAALTGSRAEPVTQPEQWTLTQLAALPYGGPSMLPLTYIAGEPALLLAASNSGELIAYDASSALHDVVWRFHLGGPASGAITHDAKHGRIFLGSSDKHIYALDQRGLFLWSFATHDTIATQPLVVSANNQNGLTTDLLVFGSEDHQVYGLDADTGELRWQYATGGGAVSAPTLADNKVIFGSQDGQVRALDAATGHERWHFATHSPVESPIATADGVAYAVSRDGTVYALEATTGTRLWTAHSDSVDSLSAPVVGKAQLYRVGLHAALYAFDRRTGQQVWRSPGENYVDSPRVLQTHGSESLLVSQRTGAVDLIDADGHLLKTWSAGASTPALTFGATVGQIGQVTVAWTMDNATGVRLLAPATARTHILKPNFVQVVDQPVPETVLSRFDTNPARYQDQALVLDSADQIYLLDPSTGKRSALLAPKVDAIGTQIDPLVTHDLALIARADTLLALHLPEGRERWRVTSVNPLSRQRPTVIGDTVLWMTSRLADSGGFTSTLQALDLSTGDTRWQIDLEDYLALGNLLSHDNNTVYLSSPPIALDLITGDARWQAVLDDNQTLGGGALSPDGSLLFVCGIHGNQSALYALNTADGSIRWHAPLPESMHFQSSIKSDGTRLFIRSNDGNLLAVRADTGQLLWHYQPRVKISGDIGLHDTQLWLMNTAGRVSVLDTATGRQTATFSDRRLHLGPERTGWLEPTFFDGSVLLPMGDQLVSLETP